MGCLKRKFNFKPTKKINEKNSFVQSRHKYIINNKRTKLGE